MIDDNDTLILEKIYDYFLQDHIFLNTIIDSHRYDILGGSNGDASLKPNSYPNTPIAEYVTNQFQLMHLKKTENQSEILSKLLEDDRFKHLKTHQNLLNIVINLIHHRYELFKPKKRENSSLNTPQEGFVKALAKTKNDTLKDFNDLFQVINAVKTEIETEHKTSAEFKIQIGEQKWKSTNPIVLKKIVSTLIMFEDEFLGYFNPNNPVRISTVNKRPDIIHYFEVVCIKQLLNYIKKELGSIKSQRQRNILAGYILGISQSFSNYKYPDFLLFKDRSKENDPIVKKDFEEMVEDRISKLNNKKCSFPMG